MTSVELYKKLRPYKTNTITAQLMSDGLSGNLSDMFSRFIKDAARCNGYNSDIFYDMKIIEKAMREYNPEEEFTPIWVGFRKHGVDGTNFILCKVENENMYGSLSYNYFALYSVMVEHEEPGWYNIILNEYAV